MATSRIRRLLPRVVILVLVGAMTVTAFTGPRAILAAMSAVLLGLIAWLMIDLRRTTVGLASRLKITQKRQVGALAALKAKNTTLESEVNRRDSQIADLIERASRIEGLIDAAATSQEEARLSVLDAHRQELITMGRQIEVKNREMGATLTGRLGRAMKEETRQIEALLQVLPNLPSNALLPSSGGWAMNARGLAHLADIVRVERPRLVLELGSGTSTVWLGHVLSGTGARLVSLDHNAEYAEATLEELGRHGLRQDVEVRIAPLKLVELAGSEFSWYDPDAIADLSEVDILLVDGPPKATGEQARWPALPMLLSRLSPGAVVLLDDIVRGEEIETLDRWMNEYPEFVREDERVSELAVLRRSPLMSAVDRTVKDAPAPESASERTS